MKKKDRKKYSGIGGQAVMEGIMMKNKDRYSVAVRKADGEIVTTIEDYKSIAGNFAPAKWPFIRGVFSFVDSLILGMKSLSFSASFFDDEDEIKEDDSKLDKKKSDENEKQVSQGLSGFMMGITVFISIVMSIGIFMLLPYFITEFIRRYIDNHMILSIIEGVFRLLIFVAYVGLISLMKDIRRVYMYHGAEHKCINCIERGKELTVENVMKCSRQHARCGTSFMLFVMFVSIVLFMFIKTPNPALRVVVRILLIPVISGISYEIIRLAGKTDNIIVNLISLPGLLLQRLTTREPDPDMVEVAIAAVEAVFDWKEYYKENYEL